MKPEDRIKKVQLPRRNEELAEDENLTEDEKAVEPPEADPDDPVEQSSVDSFPASDPPAFSPSHAGKPDRMRQP